MLAGRYLSTGIYSIPEASRLTGIARPRLSRWLRGYSFKSDAGTPNTSEPVWSSQLPPLEDVISLSFLDLIEARLVAELRDRGVSWVTIRRAHRRASEMFQNDHPFATTKMCTDGRDVFVEIARSDEGRDLAIVDLAESQYAFRSIVKPYLDDLHFVEGVAAVWWPRRRTRIGKTVLLDPERSFGQPIIDAGGVPTAVLASAVSTEGGDERAMASVASWYDVKLAFVKDAVLFERSLAA